MTPTTYLGKRSHAAAQLAGIAALIREVESDFTVQELRELLAQTASQTGNQYFPNVSRAIESLLNK